jgi:hypothetical protein
VSAGDLQETYLPALGDSWSTQDLSKETGTPASYTTPTALFHDGYTSVYTVNGNNGDLWETYLPAAGFPGDPWVAQDLSANYHTPAVDVSTSPTAVFHDGYVSVYTVDAATEDLQETYLPALGDSWVTQNLSTLAGTPAVNVVTSPAAVVHNGYTSVYTVDATATEGPGDLQETYLPAIGDSWATQDLSTEYEKTPEVAPGEPPVPLTHPGYTSVYTVDAGDDGTGVGDLQETYLPAIGGPWSTQDLSQNYHIPASETDDPLTALLHYDTSGGLTWTSVYSFDTGTGDVQESYLPVMGDSWSTQDLTALPPHAPAI